MTKPYELLIFDWDGTLMDSESRIVACLEGAIRETGAPPLQRAVLSNVIGLGLAEAVAMLYPDAEPGLAQSLAAAYRRQYLDPALEPCELFEGVGEILHELAEQGYLLAVATGKGRRGLQQALEHSGLGPLFHATRCAEETFSKPHPLMLEEIMTDLDTEPGATLMVGDTEYDIQLAHNAGTDALAVSYGVHALERLLRLEPAGHIHRFPEIRDWLQSQARRSVA